MTGVCIRKSAIIGFALLICLLPFARRLSGLEPAAKPPEATSIYPMGGRQGSVFTAEIRGQNLDKAYAVWFDCDDLKAAVKKVELVASEPTDPIKKVEEAKKKHEQRVLVEVTIGAGAKVGAHGLRLVTPGGVSGPLAVQVSCEPVLTPAEAPHNKPAQALTLNSFPIFVNGRIGKPGNVDYYQVQGEKGQEFQIEVITGSGLFPALAGTFRTPQLALYEPSGSWFDPNRIVRLEAQDESLFVMLPKRLYSSYPIAGAEQYLPRLTYRFSKAMKLLVEVGAFEGQGGPDYCYELRIARLQRSGVPAKWTPRVLAHDIDFNLEEHDFARRIDPTWIDKISSRTIEAKNDSKVSLIQEKEPNDDPAKAPEITIPGLIDGAVAHPGDTDLFEFQAKAGEALAFEIETPNLEPPYFNPRMAIRDQAGRELVTNVYRKVAGDGNEWIKTVEPKTVYTFKDAGTYYLQIRDLANRNGKPDFRYRILIRHQIPHMGKIAPKTFGIVGIETEEDRVNVVAGEAKKWEVISDEEEGFNGEFSFKIENLPPGVEAYAAAAPTRGDLPSQGGQVYEMRGTIHKEFYRPQRLETTMVLVASPDAPSTRFPQMIRLVATPILNGKPGESHVVQEYPLMVVAPKAMDTSRRTQERADASLKK